MAKKKRCTNCGKDGVWESVSRTTSKVVFCERHAPTNVVRSKDYRQIKSSKPSEPSGEAESTSADDEPSDTAEAEIKPLDAS